MSSATTKSIGFPPDRPGPLAALGPKFPAAVTGRLNACLTLSWMVGSFVLRNLYGPVLQRFPEENGHYALEAHRMGMGIMVLVLAAALGWFLATSLVLRARRAAA